MIKTIFISVLTIILFPSIIFSQSHLLKANGELLKLKKNLKSEQINARKNGKSIPKDFLKESSNDKITKIQGTLDTLSYYGLDGYTDFGFNGQDVMMQYFVAPADMIIHGIGFSCSDDSGVINGADISVRLVKLNWSWGKLDSINNDIYMGYYPSEDSLSNPDYFGENTNGTWVDSTNGIYPLPPWTNNADPSLNTWDFDMWTETSEDRSHSIEYYTIYRA